MALRAEECLQLESGRLRGGSHRRGEAKEKGEREHKGPTCTAGFDRGEGALSQAHRRPLVRSPEEMGLGPTAGKRDSANDLGGPGTGSPQNLQEGTSSTDTLVLASRGLSRAQPRRPDFSPTAVRQSVCCSESARVGIMSAVGTDSPEFPCSPNGPFSPRASVH